MSSGRFRYLSFMSELASSGSSKYQRTWGSFRAGLQECTSMQVHRMHTRRELQSVEHQIHRPQMFDLSIRISE